MVAKFINDVRPSNFDSALARAPFDEALEILKRNGYKVISAEIMYNLDREARKRSEKGDGYSHSLFYRGNFIAEGIVAYQDEPQVIVAESPLLTNKELIQQIINANKNERFYVVDGRSMYDMYRVIAEEELLKDPKDRKASLVFPSASRPWESEELLCNPNYWLCRDKYRHLEEDYAKEHPEEYQKYKELLELSKKYNLSESFVCQNCSNLDLRVFNNKWLRKINGTVVNQMFFVPEGSCIGRERYLYPTLKSTCFLSSIEDYGIRGIKPLDPIFVKLDKEPIERTYSSKEIIGELSKILREKGLEGIESLISEDLKIGLTNNN